jgi:hypothetical protein
VTGLTHLLYLHGFRSSPQSFKARRMFGWLSQHRPDIVWCCPQLPPSPSQAIRLIEDNTARWPHDSSAVMGSSLGGFYATWVHQHWHWPAVLINPAVNPARDLTAFIGEQTAFHNPDERLFFHPDYVDELRRLDCGALNSPQHILAVIAKGDEVLDWREMSARYAAAHTRLVECSDHALSDFEDHLPHILRFLGLAD